MLFVLGPWLWDAGGPEDIGPHWRSPEGCAGLLDLRSIPQQSIAGGSPEGFGLFALRNSAPNPGSSYRRLGTALDDSITPTVRRLIVSQLGVGGLESGRLDLLLYELLTMKGDHTGDTFARPLMPGMDRRMPVWLARRLVHRERFLHDAIQHRAALRQMREQYRANRLAESAGRLPRDHHRRVLDFTRKKLGLDWRLLVPPEFVSDPGPLSHRTIITESFNTGDGDILGPDLSWTEVSGDIDIVSNQAAATNAASTARADSDLSSDDHYAQIDVVVYTANKNAAATARFSASADTMYLFIVRNAATATRRLFKRVAASFTQIGSSIDTTADTPTFTIKTEINGSSLRGYIDGSSVIGPETDTAIVGNTRCGMYTNGAATDRLDDFEAADLAVAANNPWYYYAQQAIAGAA